MPGQLASSSVSFVLDGWMRTKILLYILHILQFAVYDTILSLYIMQPVVLIIQEAFMT